MTIFVVSAYIEKEHIEKWAHVKEYQNKVKDKVIRSMFKKLEDDLYDYLYVNEKEIANGKEITFMLGLESKQTLINNYLSSAGLTKEMVKLLEEAGCAKDFAESEMSILDEYDNGVEAVCKYVEENKK